ncbi:hypothetical protein VCHC17A1_4131A, partial [Vibrio cholerae HC-17A1]
MHPC